MSVCDDEDPKKREKLSNPDEKQKLCLSVNIQTAFHLSSMSVKMQRKKNV